MGMGMGLGVERRLWARICAAAGIAALLAGSASCARVSPAVMHDLSILKFEDALRGATTGLVLCAIAVVCAAVALLLLIGSHDRRVQVGAFDKRWAKAFHRTRWTPLRPPRATPTLALKEAISPPALAATEPLCWQPAVSCERSDAQSARPVVRQGIQRPARGRRGVRQPAR